jgi:hypothetical protein
MQSNWTRTFRRNGRVLESWTQRRCSCGRFLSKHQLKYCSECSERIKTVQCEESHRRHPRKRKEVRRKACRKYYLLHSELCKERDRKWKVAHPEKVKTIQKRSNSKRREEIVTYNFVRRKFGSGFSFLKDREMEL